MMRKIKFKIWNINNEEMEDVVQINWINDNCVSVVTKSGSCFVMRPDSSEQLREWTGVCDISDAEIYEGDLVVVKTGLEDENIDEFIGVAEFDDGAFVIRNVDGEEAYLSGEDDVEIIASCVTRDDGDGLL